VLLGEYDEVSPTNGRKTYKKKDARIFLFWRDDRGEKGDAWWFAEGLDGHKPLAFNTLAQSNPPQAGWVAVPKWFFEDLVELPMIVTIQASPRPLTVSGSPQAKNWEGGCFACTKHFWNRAHRQPALQAKGIVTVVFRPGRLGMSVDAEGLIIDVEAGQAQISGIKSGMQIVTIDGGPYTAVLLKEKISGSEKYTLSCKQEESNTSMQNQLKAMAEKYPLQETRISNSTLKAAQGKLVPAKPKQGALRSKTKPAGARRVSFVEQVP
jgi:hypothetical protein